MTVFTNAGTLKQLKCVLCVSFYQNKIYYHKIGTLFYLLKDCG